MLYLALDGAISDPDYEIPEWYLLIRAAKSIGVAPWELEQAPEEWFHYALEAEAVDNAATEMRQQRAGGNK